MTEEKKSSKRFVLVEVPTSMGYAIQDNKEGRTLPENEILVEILNKLDKLEKAIG